LEAHFIVISPTAKTDGDFLLQSIASTSGRIDVLCRCTLSLMDLERKEEEEYSNLPSLYGHFLLLGEPNPPLWLHIDPKKLSETNHDEISLAALFQQFIKNFSEKNSEGNKEQDYSGQRLSNESFSEFMKEKFDRYIILSEKGRPISVISTEDQMQTTFYSKGDQKIAIFLGSQLDISPEMMEQIIAKGAEEISLGEKSYLASHVIIIFKHLLFLEKKRRKAE
jgi:tRNA pseudouridine-54 N-methylase